MVAPRRPPPVACLYALALLISLCWGAKQPERGGAPVNVAPSSPRQPGGSKPAVAHWKDGAGVTQRRATVDAEPERRGGPERQPPPGGQQWQPPKFSPEQPPPGLLPAWVFFVNGGTEALDLFSVDGDQPQHVRVLPPGELVKVSTFVSNQFGVVEQNLEQKPQGTVQKIVVQKLAEGTVEKLWACRREELGGGDKAARVVCKTEPLQYRDVEWQRLTDHMRNQCSELLQRHPEDEAYFCHQDPQHWVMAQCIYDTSDEEFQWRYAEKQKINHDGVVSDKSHVKKFTKLGHAAGTMPPDFHKTLHDHWQAGRLVHAHREMGSDKFEGVLPGCRSDTWTLPPLKGANPTLRKLVIDTVLPLVAEWAGLKTEELEFTMMYGVRMYRHGSSFPFHRDIPFTHVLSAILEIGLLELDHPDPEKNKTQDWPLEIWDHEGKVHSYPYKPGQMIFYESFSCPHGRPNPFEGREVASMFMHFRPKSWSAIDWDLGAQQKEKGRIEL